MTIQVYPPRNTAFSSVVSALSQALDAGFDGWKDGRLVSLVIAKLERNGRLTVRFLSNEVRTGEWVSLQKMLTALRQAPGNALSLPIQSLLDLLDEYS